MPQIDFLATRNDSLEVLESIARIPNTVFVSDQLFDSDTCFEYFMQGSDAVNNIPKTSLGILFWSTDTFQYEPKLFSIPVREDVVKYRLRQAENETIIGFSFSFEKKDQMNKRCIYPGMIHWENRWRDPVDGLMKPLKESSKHLIASVRRIVNNSMTRAVLNDPILLGREARELYENGQATLVCCGKEFTKGC
jgi:hypothetical protein